MPTAFHRLSDTARALGLGVVVDVVPNHMAVPTPASLNAALWSVLRDGPASPYARWFDVDWAAQERAMLMPVLGRRIGEVRRRRRDHARPRDGGEPVLRYFDHVFPVRPGHRGPAAGRAARPAVLPAGALAGRRRGAQLPAVLRHRHPGRRPGRGRAGVRRDARRAARAGGRGPDPRAAHRPPRRARRPARLRPAAVRRHRRRWVVVEKILEGDEQLPADWPCAGTTGYDALLRVGGVLVDPAGPRRPSPTSTPA